MPFGSADRDQLKRIEEQLGKLGAIAEGLAALKQQVADQQPAIDQARRDATAAITTGLAEVRAVARDAMNRTTDLVSGPLTQVNSELVAVRGVVACLDRQVQTVIEHQRAASRPEPAPVEPPQAQAEAEPKPEPEVNPEPERPQEGEPGSGATEELGVELLRAAAGIAHASLEAHRDTWAVLIQAAGNEQHFHVPGKVEDHDGFVSVRVSGPSLVAALTSLHRVGHTAPSLVTRAVADHIRGKITAAVQRVIDHPRSADLGGVPVRIVIDDRSAPDDTTGPQT